MRASAGLPLGLSAQLRTHVYLIKIDASCSVARLLLLAQVRPTFLSRSYLCILVYHMLKCLVYKRLRSRSAAEVGVGIAIPQRQGKREPSTLPRSTEQGMFDLLKMRWFTTLPTRLSHH